MATNRVRVSAYVPEDVAAVLDQAADALEQTRSSLLAEVLTNAVPVLEVLRDLATDLRMAPGLHREKLAEFAAALRPIMDSNRDEFDRNLSVVGSPPGDPRLSNRGVRIHD